MVKKVLLSSIRSHVDKAEDLLKEGSYDSLLYACLEVRFAIERLTYSKLDGYLDQVPYEVVKKWQPGQLMKALATIDSHVESSGTIQIFSEDEHGNPQELTLNAGFESFTGRWASTTYHTLSSFIHAPTLAKVDSDPHPYEKIKKKLLQIIIEINRVIDAPTRSLVALNGVSLQCKAGCGTKTKCNIDNLPKNRQIQCVNPSCCAVHIIEELPEGKYQWRLRTIKWTCRACNTSDIAQFHAPNYPEIWKCPSCNSEWLFGLAPNVLTREEWEELRYAGLIPQKIII